MATIKTLDTLDVSGKTVLVRADLNVPVKDGVVTDTTRIDRMAPTVTEILEKGGKVVLMSHFGRPKGKVDPEYSLKPVLPPLEKALGRPIKFAEDCIGDAAAAVTSSLGSGEVALLENLRYHAGEEKNDDGFAAELAKLGQAYVSDAFSAAHRAHASMEALAKKLPAAAGRLMQAEIDALTGALEAPERPVMAVVGGAKISTKLELLGNVVAKVDFLALGGGMANTFLAARGLSIGRSLAEPDMIEETRSIMAKADAGGCTILLPTDAVVAQDLAEGVDTRTVSVDAVGADDMMLDIGPASTQAIIDNLGGCKTVVWNGPLGAFETPPFDRATLSVAKAIADLTEKGSLMSVAGGGDTDAALAKADVEHRLSYVSTAGGAFLEWLEGKVLPGVAVLREG